MSGLLEKIRTAEARVTVIGAGYVGLPLALEFARTGFFTTALDTDAHRVEQLRSARSYIDDVGSDDLARSLAGGRFDATADPAVIGRSDVAIVCVPTPLNKTRDPDLSFVLSAVDQIAEHAHRDSLIVVESTAYPGATRELVVPRLERAGMAVGRDVFVAFSPERVDPGNRQYGIRNTPKVIAGSTAKCLEVALSLYRRVIEHVVPVSSTTTAEMVKLLENTFRAVNIGLVNELAVMSRRVGVDPFEVIAAAATKPFGFMPFYPGPGLGGHCIPVDPLYLSWKLRSLDYDPRFIELADAVNGAMPDHVVQRVSEALNTKSLPVRGSKILIYGVAYKRNVRDTRESPAIVILRRLEGLGADVCYMDPLVPELSFDGRVVASIPADSSYASFDAVVVVTDHSALDRERLVREARLVLDTRNALAGVRGDRDKIHGL
jgi:UDP-N-acetyl-D-glucosamine dehydrogenase